MGRPKGRPKTGGRQKGAINKCKTPIAEVFAKVVEQYIGACEEEENKDMVRISLIKDLIRIDDPKDRINCILKMSEYVLPKRKSIEVDAEVTTRNEVTELLKKMM